MDLITKILDLLKEGKSHSEISLKLFDEDEKLEMEAFQKAFDTAKKTYEVTSTEDKKVADTASKAKYDADVKAAVKVEVDAALKNIPVQGILDTAIKQGVVSEVKENPRQAMTDVGRFYKNMVWLKEGKGDNSKIVTDLIELSQKAFNAYKAQGLTFGSKVAGIVTDNDVNGAFLVRPEFDKEMDRLVFEMDDLLKAITFRSGGDKTLIDSILPFSFSFRADQNAAFAEVKPTFAQQTISYREAGGIVPVARVTFQESDFNLASEISIQAADAIIRLMVPLIATGSTGDGDPFDGFRFHPGVTNHQILDFGTGGKLVSQDLTNAYTAAPDETREQGTFVLDVRELMLLSEERGDDNVPLKTVKKTNGQWMHVVTGRPIVLTSLMSRVNTALTSNAGGTDVGAFYAVLPRFRIYRDGGAMQTATSDQIFFKEDQIGIRFITRMMQGIPVNSRTSIVTLEGVKFNEVT